MQSAQQDTGEVVAIFVAEAHGAASVAHDRARLDAGEGLAGDRYHGLDVDAQVTLVDADAIEDVNLETGWALTPQETRRNIVTRGVNLNRWEHGRFRVGAALLEGVELCEPCANLGGLLANETRSAADVVRVLTHRAGLRARIIEGGAFSVGDAVRGE